MGGKSGLGRDVEQSNAWDAFLGQPCDVVLRPVAKDAVRQDCILCTEYMARMRHCDRGPRQKEIEPLVTNTRPNGVFARCSLIGSRSLLVVRASMLFVEGATGRAGNLPTSLWPRLLRTCCARNQANRIGTNTLVTVVFQHGGKGARRRGRHHGDEALGSPGAGTRKRPGPNFGIWVYCSSVAARMASPPR